ncbi:MAG: type VI secretion system tip protein VgrG [Proteobacteria bacterium]|nr:type VI secretion system tip protein VgrG [Pseudomonadota bacterium]
MDLRTNSRVFRGKSDLEIVEVLVDEWRQRSPELAACFELQELGLARDRYPRREFVHQANISDARLVRYLLRRSGISWFFRPAPAQSNPAHEMVLFDDSYLLPAWPFGAVRYHRDAPTEQRDAITQLVLVRQLVPGGAERKTWDYKQVGMLDATRPGRGDQGQSGGSLARLLIDARIEPPHTADDDAHHLLRTDRVADWHDAQAKLARGQSGVRNLAVGQYIRIEGHPIVDAHPVHEREYVVTRLHHRAENNLPKQLQAQVHLLLDTQDDDHTQEDERRYRNSFEAVRRDVPLAPGYDAQRDAPRAMAITALVVGPADEEVHTDELGRIKIQFQGYRSEDHAHADGAGASGTDRDSAWVRWATGLAGAGFGIDFIPRVGQEVVVDFVAGDPDRPLVIGVVHNARNTPAAFSDVGHLPGNRYVSGAKTREVHGAGHNQVRHDDTPGQINLQAASSHAASQLNAGWLTHPRRDGKGQARGEGIEVRTDAQAAVRGGHGVYITAQAQNRAGGEMLERQALLGLAEQLQGIVQTLGDLSSTHHAENTDTARIAKLLEQLKAWDHGSNVQPDAAEGGAPMVAIEAPAGIAAVSQDALVLGAQSHIDAVSAGNTQISAGRRLLLRAADLFSAFAHKGIRIVSAEDKVQIEAHKEDIEITAARRVVISAGEEIVIQAPRIRYIAQGTQVDHGGGRIVEQSQSLHHIMSPDFSIGGAGGGSPSLNVPSTRVDFNQQVVMRWHGSDEPMKNHRYRITTEEGRVIEGRTDAQGKTERFDSGIAYGRYTIEPLDD